MKKLLFLVVLISGVVTSQPLDEKQYILQSQKGAVFDLITFIVEDGNFRIGAIKTNQPNLKYRQSNYNASETSFLLVFKDDNNEENYQKNIANPLFVTAQHHDFENSRYFFGLDKNSIFSVNIPHDLQFKFVDVIQLDASNEMAIQRLRGVSK